MWPPSLNSPSASIEMSRNSVSDEPSEIVLVGYAEPMNVSRTMIGSANSFGLMIFSPKIAGTG
ncbi:hypothetical protein D3C83_240520 [compost metagenome]